MAAAKRIYFLRPIRATIIIFLCLSLYCAVFLPFLEAELIAKWPLFFAYSAFLAVTVVGFLRLGRRLIWLLAVPLFVFGLLVMALEWAYTALPPDQSMQTLRTATNIGYYLAIALLAWVCCLSAVGWYLYFRTSRLQPAPAED